MIAPVYLCLYILCNSIHSSQIMNSALVLISGWMDEEIMCIKVYSAVNKNEIIPFHGELM